MKVKKDLDESKIQNMTDSDVMKTLACFGFEVPDWVECTTGEGEEKKKSMSSYILYNNERHNYTQVETALKNVSKGPEKNNKVVSTFHSKEIATGKL